MTEPSLAFVLRVLEMFEHGWSYLSWHVDCGGPSVSFDVNCNDLFWWGTSDGEEVTPENLDLLERTRAEVKALTGKHDWSCELWACRVRRERPQGCCYPDDRRLWNLFDRCGPERATGLGNPYRPGERERRDVRHEAYERKQYERLRAKFAPQEGAESDE